MSKMADGTMMIKYIIMVPLNTARQLLSCQHLSQEAHWFIGGLLKSLFALSDKQKAKLKGLLEDALAALEKDNAYLTPEGTD